VSDDDRAPGASEKENVNRKRVNVTWVRKKIINRDGKNISLSSKTAVLNNNNITAVLHDAPHLKWPIIGSRKIEKLDFYHSIAWASSNGNYRFIPFSSKYPHSKNKLCPDRKKQQMLYNAGTQQQTRAFLWIVFLIFFLFSPLLYLFLNTIYLMLEFQL
jgi:hypothetical protein